MRVLVTGGTGFLGAYVVKELLATGHEVRALSRPGRPKRTLEQPGVELAAGDLEDEASLRKACEGVQGLIHCAVRNGYWKRQNEVQRKVIVDGTSSLLRAAEAARVPRIVHVSSIAAVGVTRDGTVLDEDAPWPGTVLGMCYVQSKREAEERVMAAARAGLPVVVVNPGALTGPKLDPAPLPWHLKRIANGGGNWAPQGGTSVTDVEDVAHGVIGALLHGRVGQRYILAGHNIRWREMYEAVKQHVGKPAPVREIPALVRHTLLAGSTLMDVARLSRPPYTPEYFRLWGWYAWVNSGKAQRELGYRLRPFSETLARYRWE